MFHGRPKEKHILARWISVIDSSDESWQVVLEVEVVI